MKRFDFIEGFRAPLAWWVVLVHLFQESKVPVKDVPQLFRWVLWGGTPVFGFMILSGFVITHLIVSKQEAFGPYLFRRYMRLAPLLIVTMVAAYFMNMYGIARFWPKEDTGIRILQHVTLLHGLVPNEVYARASMTFIPPGWSISLEWQFYIVAPLIIYSIRKGGIWLAIPLGLLLAAFLTKSGYDHRLLDLGFAEYHYQKPSHLLAGISYFLTGVSLYFFKLGEGQKAWLVLPASAFLLVGGPGVHWTSSFLGVVIFYMVLMKESALSRFFSLRPLTFLGKISYSTYLLHFPLVVVIKTYTRPHFEAGWPQFWVNTAIALPLVLLVSVAGYYLIEKPTMQFASHVTKRRMRPRITAAGPRQS